MKALFKTLPILIVAGALSVSCGSGDNSSGSSTSSNGTGWVPPGTTVTQQTSYGSIDQVRAAFQSKSFADGAQANSEFYHLGNFFGGGSGGGININFNWCWNDCYVQQIVQAMEDRISYGRQIKVNSASTDSVSFSVATGVDENNGNPQFVYGQSGSMNRNSGLYREMLGLDISENNLFGGSAEGIKVMPATITLQNGSSVVGQMVEFFIGHKSQYGCSVNDVKRYVLSSTLPIVANPVVAIENGQATGKLAEVSSQNGLVMQVTVNGYHQFNYQNCTIQPVQQQLTY